MAITATPAVAQSLLDGKFLINLNNLVSNPMRTGIQRVCYEFCTRWPQLDDTIAFVEIGLDRIGLLDPDFFESVRALFEVDDPVLRALGLAFPDLPIDASPGWIGLLAARNRIVCEVPVVQALDSCRAVLSLEESLNLEFYSLAAAVRPEKIFNLCHDFLSWTHSEFFATDWRMADNVSLSLSNRRKYTHNIFTSTATRAIFVDRINRGDSRTYQVIAPGADGLGRTYRRTAPQSREFLVVGTLEPRKQPLHILHAFERLQAGGCDAQLCFAGRMGWLEAADKAELLAAFKRYPWVRWINSPSDDELRDLMMDCRATIYMSVAEGFGSPPVESLALGVPVIVTADLPSILDIAPNGQVRVGADDGEGLATAVSRLLDDAQLCALQAEIETLALPTWQGFVDGISDLVAGKATAAPDADVQISYRARLAVIEALALMRQIDRVELIDRLVRAATLNDDARRAAYWHAEGERAGWSNVETVLNLMAAFPAALPANLVKEALAGQPVMTDHVAPSFAAAWRERFARLLQVADFPTFYAEIYTDLLDRTPGSGEVVAHMPADERDDLRTVYLRGAIESEEYRRNLETKVRERVPEGYLDHFAFPTVAWTVRVLRYLHNDAAVERALLFEHDERFVDAASLDLLGQPLAPDDRASALVIAQGRHGRERVVLRMLLSEQCLRRVQAPDVHMALIRRLAARAGFASGPDICLAAIPGRVSEVLALDEGRLADGFAVFFGRAPGEPERALLPRVPLNEPGDNVQLLVARLILYGTLTGAMALSADHLGWAVARIVDAAAQAPSSTANPSRATIANAFEAAFGRSMAPQESGVVAAAQAAGASEVIVAQAIRVAALRGGAVTDLLTLLAQVARDGDALVAGFAQVETLAQALRDARPVVAPTVWRQPVAAMAEAHPVSPTVSPFAAPAVQGEIVTLDQLMALEGSDFVRAAYDKLLLREADDSGLRNYVDVLHSSRSKAVVIYSIATSPEGRAVNANLIGLPAFIERQRRMRRWPMRKLLAYAGIQP